MCANPYYFVSVPKTGVPLLLCLGKSLVVILNYALTAEQPDPCGPEPYSPGKRPRTRSPLGEGPVAPRIPEEVDLSQNSRGPGPPYTIRTPQRGRNRHPAWGGVRSRHVSAGADTHGGAALPREVTPTYRIECGW